MANIYGDLVSADLENSANDPSSPTNGRIYLNTTSHVGKIYANSGWHTLMDLDTAQTATNKTFTSPVINTGISGTAIVDEDDMSSDSATKVPTQQSVKAFVENQISAVVGASDSIDDRLNFSLSCSVGASALTIALKDAGGSDPSAGSPVSLGFRSETASDGTYSLGTATAATSVVVPSTATLGHSSGVAQYIYVYALNNAATIELVVSSTPLDETVVHTTTAIDTASDSLTGKYSTSARTSKAIRFLGRMLSTQATAGTWASVPSEISTRLPEIQNLETTITLDGGGGFTTGTLKLSRKGNLVVAHLSNVSHSSQSSVSSAANVIPTYFRPYAEANNLSDMGGTVARVQISTAGTLSLTTRDWAGSVSAVTSSGPHTIAYIAAN